MQYFREKFPDAEVITINEGPWKLYIYGTNHFYGITKWFRKGEIKYPDEEITFDRAKGRADNAIQLEMEVRVCDGMDNLVFHSINGKIVYGSTFWNEAKPDPTAGKVAKRLTGGKK